MTNHQYEHLEKKINRRAQRRQNKKKPKMKVSGDSVKKLQTIIIKKTKP